jgi:ribosome biogenesis SPOUT family RNA methylase Rps3
MQQEIFREYGRKYPENNRKYAYIIVGGIHGDGIQ